MSEKNKPRIPKIKDVVICLDVKTVVIVECSLCGHEQEDDLCSDTDKEQRKFAKQLIKDGWRDVLVGDEEHFVCPSCARRLDGK